MPGMSIPVADGMLAAYFQGVPFANTALWAQPHLGDPGSDGTDNEAAETTRVDAFSSFGTDPVDDGTGTGRIITSDADIGPWETVPATEDWTHVSYWSAEVHGTGTYLGCGALTTSKAVVAGDDATITAGHATARFANA